MRLHATFIKKLDFMQRKKWNKVSFYFSKTNLSLVHIILLLKDIYKEDIKIHIEDNLFTPLVPSADFFQGFFNLSI